MIYILSRSSHYYPSSGISDWEALFEDEDKAKEALGALDLGEYETACVIVIDPQTLRYEELWERDMETGGEVQRVD